MQQTFTLSAGVPYVLEAKGRYFLILSKTGVGSLSANFWDGRNSIEQIDNLQRGTRVHVEDGFNRVVLTATAACTVEVLITWRRIDVDVVSGATVKVTADTPLPVSNDRGAPGSPVYVSGITYSDAPAVSLTNGAAVAVGAAAVAIVTANAARRAVRMTNLGPDPVAIGAPGITWAARCVVLEAGDTWVEERAANLAWSAIANTGATGSVTAQEVLT